MTGLEMKYFVLNPNKQDAYGNASRCALTAYAKAIQPYNDALADDLMAWVRRIEQERTK